MYTAGAMIGPSVVVCALSTSPASCTDAGLVNGTAYHYAIFSRDSSGNYSTGAVPTGSPATPSAGIALTGVDDASADGNRPYVVQTAPAVSADSGYSGLDASDVSATRQFDVHVVDSEGPGGGVSHAPAAPEARDGRRTINVPSVGG